MAAVGRVGSSSQSDADASSAIGRESSTTAGDGASGGGRLGGGRLGGGRLSGRARVLRTGPAVRTICRRFPPMRSSL